MLALVATMSLAGGCALLGGEEPQKPAEDVVRESITNLSNVTSGSYELTMKGTAVGSPGQTPENINFDGSIAGLFDNKDPKKPQFTMKLGGTLSLDAEEAQAVDVELRLDKANLYVNLTKLPDLGDSIPKEMVAAFANKWWQIAIPEGTFDQLPIGGQDETTMTPEQKALKELVDKTEFFKDLKFEGNDTVDGTDCYHYVGSLDKDSIKTFLTEASKIQNQTMTETDLQNIDAFFNSTTAPSDIWIDSSNMTLKKFGTKIVVAPENSGSLTMEFAFMVGDLDKEITVEVPAGATLFDPAMLFGGVPLAE